MPKPTKGKRGSQSRRRPTVKLDPDFHRQLKVILAERDEEFQSACLEGLKLWMAGRPLPTINDLNDADQVLAAVVPRVFREAENIAAPIKILLRGYLGQVGATPPPKPRPHE